MEKGLALLPDFMAQFSIQRGDIQHIQNMTLQSGYGYYVVVPSYRLNSRKVSLFYDWLKKKNKLGGQHKVPRLSNKRDFVEELLKL